MSEKQIEKELQAVAVQFETKCAGGYAPETLSLKAYIEKWLEQSAPNLAPKTLEHYKLLCIRIFPALGHVRLDKLSPVHIQEFYTRLSAVISERTGKPLAGKTKNHYHVFLSAVLTSAYKMRLTDVNIISLVTLPKPERRMEKRQTADMLSAVLPLNAAAR
jgi:hypothetical protein